MSEKYDKEYQLKGYNIKIKYLNEYRLEDFIKESAETYIENKISSKIDNDKVVRLY